ncbi:MAG: anthranilate synthase component I family protein [Pyrinomonadaceae bacterium]|nr:anthranilate synthase component I family protein [Pyrinomonadaceae bacterium]
MLEISPRNFDEFVAEMKNGNVVPIVRSVLADLHTPVSAFMRVCGDAKQSFLLESVEGGERLARYSFLAANPMMTIRAHNRDLSIEKSGTTKALKDVSLFEYFREYFEQNKLAHRENLPPLCGGAVGFLTYDAVRWFEPILDDNKYFERDDAVWMFFKTILAFDRLKQRIEIVSVVFTDEAQGDEVKLKELYNEAVAETERIEILLSETAKFPSNPPQNGEKPKGFESNWTKKGFMESVQKIQEHILAGDAYQVVLSQRFSRKISSAPVNIYRALRTTNPSPYMFYLKFGDEILIGASPEMLVRCRGTKLDYRPIAGTRPRGINETEDWILGEDMRSDEKEISEHVMLVDLGRNDLGRIAEYGSVTVEDLMTIERYSHVQHLVTSLSATLREGFDRFDALASCFPAGTVSGAPKVSAMHIIKELEPTHRGVYAGAVGYIDYDDNLDTCIAIRTLQLRNGMAYLQAGAGVVADSVPEKEYEETINKARALVKAIEIAEKGL